MRRRIDGWQQDEAGDWVALLACGHRQHIRHRPPLWPNPWVGQEEGRTAHLGTPLDCPLCEPGESRGVAAAAAPGSERSAPSKDVGGEAACLANLICPHCDAVIGDGGHRPTCPAASAPTVDPSAQGTGTAANRSPYQEGAPATVGGSSWTRSGGGGEVLRPHATGTG